MKASLLLFWLFFSLVLPGFSQDAVSDSLKMLLRNKPAADARLDVLYELVRANYRTNLSEAKKYYAELHTLSATNKGNLKGRILDYTSKGILHLSASELNKAEAAFRKGFALTNTARYPKQRAELLNNLGIINYYEGDIDSALFFFETSLAIKKQLGDSREIVKSLSNIGSIYSSQSRMQKALAAYLEVLKYDEKLHDKPGMAADYTNISMVLYDKGEFADAGTYARKALAIFNELHDTLGIGRTWQNLGIIDLKLKKYESAKENFGKAIHYLLSIGHSFELSKAEQGLANVFVATRKFREAEEILVRNLEVKRELEDWTGVAAGLGILAEVYFKTGRENLAIQHLLQSNQLASKSKRNDFLLNNNKLLSEIYASKGDFKNAFVYYNNYTAVKDTLAKDAYSRQLSELQTLYETEKKEQQIAGLNQENQIQKLTINRRNTWLGIVAGLFGVSAIIAFLFYQQYKLKQEARLQTEIIKQQDLSTKAILEAEENERKRIAADLHDGLGQIFSAVKMNLSNLEGQVAFTGPDARRNYNKTLALVDESCKEVRSISHQMAPNILLKSGLVTAVRDFVTKIDHNRLNVNLFAEGLNERLDTNVETVLYRVIQESVNNVIKHAQANQLDIQLLRETDGLTVMIEDNGKGFELASREAGNGIGLKNMVTRVEYLKGTVDFDSAPGKGTVVSIWVPISAN